MKKFLMVVGFALIVLVVPTLHGKLKKENINIPQVKMEVNNIPKPAENIVSVILLSALLIAGVRYAAQK